MKLSRMLLCAVTALTADACGGSSPTDVDGIPSRTFSLTVGGKLDIQLQTIGPGEYASPPNLIGATIHFLGVGDPGGIVTPAGVKQVFHFEGVAAGRTIIEFRSTNVSGITRPDVVDTVIVR